MTNDRIIVVDAALYHEIDDPKQLDGLINGGKIQQAPAGTDADYFVLETLKRNMLKWLPTTIPGLPRAFSLDRKGARPGDDRGWGCDSSRAELEVIQGKLMNYAAVG